MVAKMSQRPKSVAVCLKSSIQINHLPTCTLACCWPGGFDSNHPGYRTLATKRKIAGPPRSSSSDLNPTQQRRKGAHQWAFKKPKHQLWNEQIHSINHNWWWFDCLWRVVFGNAQHKNTIAGSSNATVAIQWKAYNLFATKKILEIFRNFIKKHRIR